MRFSKAKRIICTCTALALIFSQSAYALLGGFTYSYPIGVGTSYSRQEGYNESGLQKASIITYKPNSSVSPIGVRSGDEFYGNRKSISQITSSLEAQGYDVIGGINADFFSFSDGVPTGLFVDNGRLIAATDWESAIGFMADGSAIIGDPISNIVVSGESGKISVFDYNKTRTTRGLYLLDHYYSSETHFGSAGQSIIMQYDDPSTLKIGQPITLTVVNKVSGSYSFPIADNQMVLTKRDDCTSMPWVDFQIGEKVTIDFQTNDPRWSNVVYAVGGKKLITDGVVTTSGIDSGSSLAARSAAGIKADGTVVLYEVDGSQSGYSKGLTAKQLASELTQLGCVSAVCLDGGGSSAMTVKNPSKDSSITVTKPSDGSERKCSTYIFLVNNAVADGVAKNIHLEPTSHYVLPSGKVSFTTTVLDGAFKRISNSEEVTYTASAGSVSNGILYAPKDVGVVTVNASTPSGASGSMQIYVTDEPTAMSLLKGGKAVSSISAKVGDSVQLDAVMYRNGIFVSSTNEQITWSVSNGLGTIENGLFKATKAGTGTIYASRYGVSKSITVSVGMGEPQKLQVIADFEQNQPMTSDENSKLSVTKDINNVARGYSALEADYSGTSLNISAPNTTISSEKALTLWAKLASGQGDLQAVFTDSNGGEIVAPFDKSVQSAYRQLKVSVPNGAVTFNGIRLLNATNQDGKLYLDHVLLSEFAVTNTDAPAITVTSSKLDVSAGQSASITAKITQNSASSPVRSDSVKVYIDGVQKNVNYQTSTSTVSVTTDKLSAGTHVLIIEAQDDAGNISSKVFTINAGKNTNSKFTDISNSWASGYINLVSERGLMNGSQNSNGKWVFNPNSNLKRSEFAVIMSNVLDLDVVSSGDLPFDDASSIPSWAKDSVLAVYNAGIMNGKSTASGKLNFNPNDEITRAEVMTVIARCLPRGYEIKNSSFIDASSIPSWAKDSVNYVTSAGIINGYSDGSVKPNANITRAEIASVICKLK